MNAEFSTNTRGGLPPVPALIPINTVLRPHGGSTARASQCDDGDSESGFSVDRVSIERDSGGGRHSRTRRSTAQPVHSIDPSVGSRDRCVTSQAPTRRPERHRKSDRRRCRQRVERQKCITTSLTCSTTHNTVRRKVVSRSPDKSEPTTVPRVNPIFLWVKQEDTRIVEVRCEDYDKRNRIRLTKTAHGWRAIPRTETLAPSRLSPIPSESHSDHPKIKQRSKSKSHKSSKSKRKLLEHQSSVENGYRESDEAEESEVKAYTVARAKNVSPAWSAPVNIESLLPSHTITVPRKKVLVDEADAQTVKDSECCVNSGDCSTPPRLPSPNSNITGCNDVRPLDNLLAVAEFEFNHQLQTEKELQQQQEENDKEHESLLTASIELSESLLPEITEPIITESNSRSETEIETDTDKDQNIISSSPQYEIAKDAYETVADLSEQHKEFFDNIVQLNKLIESRAEKINNATITIIEQSKEAVGIERHPEDCDYNDDEENNITMDDLITRLEQSLQSPDNCNDVDQLCAEASNFISIDLTEKDENNDSMNNNEMVENANINNLNEQGNSKTEFECTNEIPNDNISSSKEIPMETDDIISIEHPHSNFVEKNSDNLCEEANIVENDIKDNLSSDNDEPTDLSISHKRNNEAEYEEFTESVEDDLLPTDLSFPKNQNPTPPLRIETPRPPSHSSETIQSPQPSGIPAVPPSPDIFFSNSQKSKSLFLETLLSSSSPKLCLTPEVTITRQQKEPLDLGKSRKSASPTITCSEEVKVKNDTFKYDNIESEPNAKKMKIEDITLKNLLDKTKTDVKVSRNSPIEKSETNNNKVDSSKLLQLLTNDVDLDPQIQFKQLLLDQELNVPDPLLVPKDKLSQILAAPAIEIPRLLASRPELRLPDALAFPQLLQNPDILVISLAQLQLILQKQSETLKLQETLTKNIEKPTVKVTKSPSQKPEIKSPNSTHESSSHHQPSSVNREHSTKTTNSKPKENKGVSGLANDIDAATTAAFNQMLWLPYLNQLEATAAACGNNPDFLKALNSVFPPSMPVMDTNHFFPNFGLQNSFPPPVDYTNPLEMAMWQEALMKSNMSNQMQQSYQRTKNLSENFQMKMPYREDNNNIAMESRNLHLSKKNALQKLHTSARTSPIVHHFQQLSPHQQPSRFGPIQESPMQSNMGLGGNPYLNSIPSVYQFSNPNLQMPQYNTNFPHWSRSQHSPRVNHSSKSSGVSNYPSYNNNGSSKHDYIKYQQSLINAYSQRKHSQEKQSVKSSKHVENNFHIPTSSPSSQQQKPRVTCKSLQNLLSPSRLTQDLSLKKFTHDSLKHLPSSTSITPLSTQPIDLSNMRHDMTALGSRFKVKHHLADSMRPPKLFKHDEIPEVGSTTASIEEMTTAQLHDAQTQLWHPLFGNAPLQHAM